MKKLAIAAAAAAAMGAAPFANAANTIIFDPDGSNTNYGNMTVSSFDWSPDNGLGIGALSTVPVAGTSTFQVVAQGKLGSLVAPGNVSTSLALSQLTFQINFFESANNIGGVSSGFTLGPGASSYQIYYNPNPTAANQITGTGYGAGGAAVLILQGTLVGLTGTFTNSTLLSNLLGTPDACFTSASACGLLDQSPNSTDNQNNTRSYVGNGSTTIQVNVNYADPTFFKSSVTTLTVDLQDTSNNVIPFVTAEPSDAIMGFTPTYSLVSNGAGGFLRVNGAPCTVGGQTETGASPTPTRCDIHLQTDASTSFNSVPEPGTLAVTGLGLGLLGLARRRKTAA